MVSQPGSDNVAVKPLFNLLLITEKEDTQMEIIENFQDGDEFFSQVCIPYFRDIFQDLSKKSNMGGKGIKLLPFLEYVNLPGILGERFFSVLDANNQKLLTMENFVDGMESMYHSDFNTKLQLVFKIYDFDKNELISKDDIKTILAYVPLQEILSDKKGRREGIFTKEGGANKVFLDNVQSMEEIKKLTDSVFKDKDRINFAEFKEINEKTTSELFFCIYQIMKLRLPRYESFRYYEDMIRRNNHAANLAASPSPPSSPTRLASPKFLSSFLPVSKMIRGSPTFRKITRDKYKQRPHARKFILKNGKMVPKEESKSDDQLTEEKHSEEDMEEHKSVRSPIHQRMASFEANSNHLSNLSKIILSRKAQRQASIGSPSPILNTECIRITNLPIPSTFRNSEENSSASAEHTSDSEKTIYCECGTQCLDGNACCDSCKEEKKIIREKGFLYVQTKTNKLKRFW